MYTSAACVPVEVIAGIAGIASAPVDGQIPGCAGFQHAGPELVAGEALHLDVDADRGEVFDDDLGCSRAAASADSSRAPRVAAAAGETTGRGDIGCERIDVLVAEARDAGREVHLRDRRMRVEAAAVRRQGSSVDGVVGRAAHARVREEGRLVFSLIMSTSAPGNDEVLLLAATRGRAAGAVATFEAGAPVGRDAVDCVVET